MRDLIYFLICQIIENRNGHEFVDNTFNGGHPRNVRVFNFAAKNVKPLRVRIAGDTAVEACKKMKSILDAAGTTDVLRIVNGPIGGSRVGYIDGEGNKTYVTQFNFFATTIPLQQTWADNCF